MTIKFCNYTNKPGYTDDFFQVYEFLLKRGRDYHMEWVRWEWPFAMGIQDKKIYENIGMWKDDGKIKALTLYDDPGTAWLVTETGYEFLRLEMLVYAEKSLNVDGKFLLSINDNDKDFQALAHKRGYRPTQNKDRESVLELTDENLQYSLPEGYSIVSLSDEFDMQKYNKVMWLGFNHPEPVPENDKQLEFRRYCVTSPHSNHDLLIAVKSPEEEFVSHCGGWYIPGHEDAIIEPVAAVPEYRKKGLGKAAVLEACKRCRQLGAKWAYVGSSQQFYYNIGFMPYSNETFWSK